jgi:hypothetical protein
MTDSQRIDWLVATVRTRDVCMTVIPDAGIELRLSPKDPAAIHIIRATLRDAIDAAIEASES